MQIPSDQWKKLRRAALERARRKMIEPLEVVHLALLGASALYLVGFLRFKPIRANRRVLLGFRSIRSVGCRCRSTCSYF